MFKLYPCYACLLYSAFIYSYYVQKYVKIISINDEKQNKKFCEDENIQFNFIGTKIKIRYIYRDEKLI